MESKKTGPDGKPYTIKADLEFLVSRIDGIQYEIKLLLDQEIPSVLIDCKKLIKHSKCKKIEKNTKETKELYDSVFYRWHQLQPVWGFINMVNPKVYKELTEFFEVAKLEYNKEN